MTIFLAIVWAITITHDTQTEFSNGTFNRVIDIGTTDASPILQTYYEDFVITADANTVGLWYMDETVDNSCSGGQDICDSSNSYHGNTTASITSGHSANGRSFNGTGDFSNLGSNPITGNAAFTIEAWLKNSTSGDYGLAVTIGDGGASRQLAYIGYADSGLGGGFWNANYPTNVDDNEWHHVAMTYSGGADGQMIIYIDGINKIEITENPVLTSTAITFGAEQTATGYFYNGLMDEVRLSNVARTPEEVYDSYARSKYSSTYSIYTSNVIDIGDNVTTWSDFTWNELGVGTGDGETSKDNTGLVAQWNFNETGGTTADNAEGTANLDGTLSGFDSTTSQDADPDSSWTANNKRWGAGALQFDGVDSYVEITSSPTLGLSNAITVEAWIYSKTTTQGSIVSRSNVSSTPYGWNLSVENDGRIRFWAAISDGSTTGGFAYSKSSISPGTWNHVVGIIDGTNNTVYVNGIAGTTTTRTSSTINNGSQNISIGRWPSAGWYFDGTIDTTRIYSRALTADEVLSNYNSSNIQFQTRVGPDNTPNSGNWDEWSPTTGETTLATLDADVANWAWDNTSTYAPSLTSNESNIKIEGTGSLKISLGKLNTDANTDILYHLDATNHDRYYTGFPSDHSILDVWDSSGNDNDGEFGDTSSTSNTPTLIDGISDKARSLDGVDDIITANSASNTINNFTFEAWFTVNSTHEIDAESTSGVGGTSGQKYLFGAYNRNTDGGAGVSVGTNGVSVYEHGAGYMPALAVYSGNINSGDWHHLAIVYTNKQPKIYLDGELVHTGLVSTKTNVYAPHQFGGGSYGYHDGNIDEIRVSNVVRSPEEIAEIHRLGTGHYMSKSISSIDLSDKNILPFYIASDRVGNYLEVSFGESSYSNNTPDANTIGLWHLDEQSGAGAYLRDSTTNSHNGTPSGVTYARGKSAGGRSFDGSNDQINITSTTQLQLGSNQTIEAWILPNLTPGGWQRIIGKGDGNNRNYGIWIDQNDNGRLLYQIYNLGGSTTCNFTSNYFVQDTNWHYIAVTYDGTTGRFYVDGVETGRSNCTVTPANNTDQLIIGSHDSASYYNGLTDEIRISNITRTPEEIRNSYESNARTHSINIDFAAKLTSSITVINSVPELSFNIDATTHGLLNKGSNIYTGDKIIVKENFLSTEYIAQGTVVSVDESTGAITVDSWDAGSIFPPNDTGLGGMPNPQVERGFQSGATVFKWQREYFDVSRALDTQLDEITSLTFRVANAHEGMTIYLDGIKSVDTYLTNPLGSTITSNLGNRFFQYRSIITSSDQNVSAQLANVIVDAYTTNPPTTPTIENSWLHDNVKLNDTTPEVRFISIDSDADDLIYQIEWDTDSDFLSSTTKTSDVDIGFANITTPADTNPFTQNELISYTWQVALIDNTTYFYKIRSYDGQIYSDWSEARSLTIDTTNILNSWFQTLSDQFIHDTLTGNASVNISDSIISNSGNGTAQSTMVTASDIDTAINWGELIFSDIHLYGDINYQIYYDNAGTPTIVPDGDLTSNSTGFGDSPVDISSLATSTYPELYVLASFTYGGAPYPFLYDWEITLSSNTPSVASSVNIDSGATDINLTVNNTNSVVCVGTITDNNGFVDVISVTAELYRTGVGSGAADDDNNHYSLSGDTECIPSNGVGNNEDYTCTFDVYYHAESTDVGSTYEADNWTCLMTPTDTVETGTPDDDTIEMNSLTGLVLSGPVDYLNLNEGSSSASNPTSAVYNAGNTSIDMNLSGSNMSCITPSCTGTNITVGQQQYSLSSFTYGSGTVLGTSSSRVELNLTKPTLNIPTSNSNTTVYWGINIPSAQKGGDYQGTNICTAILNDN